MDNLWVIIPSAVAIIAVLITAYYSYSTKKDIEKKVEDTKTELAMATRPLLVVRAVDRGGVSLYEADTPKEPKIEQSGAQRPMASHFSHFELYNAGTGPAIGLEISLMNKDKVILQSQSVGFLRNNEQALSYVPIKVETDKIYYLVSEYESIRSRATQNPVWYQTWLPFMPLKCTDKKMVNISVGEMAFKEVSLSERIDAFPSNLKPQ